MQRVDPSGRSVPAIVAVLAAFALLGAGLGGSIQSASPAVAHLCPPVC
jgi:hypothetical protein